MNKRDSKQAEKRGDRALRLWPLWGLMLGLCLFGVWRVWLVDQFIPRRWGVVEPGRLYRSGQLTAPLVDRVLRWNDIEVIVDLTSVLPDDPDQCAESEAVARLGIEKVRLPLYGNGTGDVHRYVAAISAIHKAVSEERPALVHCVAGSQRTGGVIGAYELLVQGKKPRRVLKDMRRYGLDVRKDQVLLTYLNDNLPAMAQMLTSAGVIDGAPDPMPVLKP